MRLDWRQLCGAAALLLQGQVALADLGIQANDADSLKKAGKTITEPMIEFYHANETEGIPGKLTDTWYIAGSMFMTYLQYWDASGDDTYNSLVSHDLMFQAGDNYDYFPANWSQWLGNDDQMFWGLAAMTAAETGFPEVDGKPSWSSMARAVFEMQAGKWDTGTCNGGLHWQCWPIQAGYTMKNSISNGGLFFLAARLARFTKNETYVEWAETIWDWSVDSPLVNNKTWHIADSTNTENNCQDAGDNQWTYNYGTYLGGAVFLANYTNGGEKWTTRANGILDVAMKSFFPPKYGSGEVLSEVACDPIMTCDRNQLGFKGYMSMWLAFTALLMPETYDKIAPKLQSTVLAVSKQCSGESKSLCGEQWWNPTWDGMQGLEVQMAALGAVTANLMLMSHGSPKTVDTNPDGGADAIDTGDDGRQKKSKITTGDRAGAWILTVVMIVFIAGGMGWLVKS